MQRIADHISNGAYFYTVIDREEEREWVERTDSFFESPDAVDGYVIFYPIEGLITKLMNRYSLKLTPRQRNYRLEQGLPICTCIVQRDVFKPLEWKIYLLFTTPKTRDFNAQCGVSIQKLAKEKEREKVALLQQRFSGFKWNKTEIKSELELISSYFNDQEPLKFVLTEPVAVKVTDHMTFEIIRTSHKVYKHSSKSYKQPIKSFSWSWRYSEESLKLMKNRLINILNKTISQRKPSTSKSTKNSIQPLAIQAVRDFINMIETWAVFKSNRQQSGELLHFARRFTQRRGIANWSDIGIDEPHLVYLPRLETYAESLSEYKERRDLFDQYKIEIPLDLVREDDLFAIMKYANAQKEKNKANQLLLDELTLNILT